MSSDKTAAKAHTIEEQHKFNNSNICGLLHYQSCSLLFIIFVIDSHIF